MWSFKKKTINSQAKWLIVAKDPKIKFTNSPIMVLIKGKYEIILSQIGKEDGLPKNICQRCIYKLDMFYEFRLNCISTDTILKNYAESLKDIALSNQVSKIFLCKQKLYCIEAFFA